MTLADQTITSGARRLPAKGAIHLGRRFIPHLFWQTLPYIVMYTDNDEYNDNDTNINTNVTTTISIYHLRLSKHVTRCARFDFIILRVTFNFFLDIFGILRCSKSKKTYLKS